MAPVLYAQTPARRGMQVAADIGVVIWVFVAVRLALAVRERVEALGRPGLRVESAGEDLAGQMDEAGRRIEQVPLVGDEVRRPFDGAADAALALASAGRSETEAAVRLAMLLSTVLVLLALLVVLLKWLPWRYAFIREATAAQRVLGTVDDLDLFAMRALARQPLTVIAQMRPGVAEAWRRGDEDAVRALAELELRSCGLRPRSLARGGRR